MNFLPVDVEGGQEEGKGQEVCNGASFCVTRKARSLHPSLLVSPWLLVLRIASESKTQKLTSQMPASLVTPREQQLTQTWSLFPVCNWTEDRIILIVLHFHGCPCKLRCSRRENKKFFSNEKALSEDHLHVHMSTGGCLTNAKSTRDDNSCLGRYQEMRTTSQLPSAITTHPGLSEEPASNHIREVLTVHREPGHMSAPSQCSGYALRMLAPREALTITLGREGVTHFTTSTCRI